MDRKNLEIRNATLYFRNFSGKPGKFNNEGNRNFCILLEDPDLVDAMVRDGWNVRYLTPKDPMDSARPYIQVAVSYRNIPPTIYLIRGNTKTILDENDVNILDYAEIKNADLVISPYPWNVAGRSGVKGYLKLMYVVLEDDPFAEKYQDIPDSALSSVIENDPFRR